LTVCEHAERIVTETGPAGAACDCCGAAAGVAPPYEDGDEPSFDDEDGPPDEA
jgi:hypothetical protein